MKLDIKKIALIIGASIFAFSGVFGQDQTDAKMRGEDKGKMERKFDTIQINNKLKDRKITIDLNKGRPGAKSIEVKEGQQTVEVPKGKVRMLNIMVQGLKDRLKEINLDQEDKEAIVRKIREEAQKLRAEGITIKAEAKGKTLEINIDKGNEVTADV